MGPDSPPTGALAPFRNRAVLWLWLGVVLSSIGSWSQTVGAIVPGRAGASLETIAPDPADVAGFYTYVRRFSAGLPIERAAVANS